MTDNLSPADLIYLYLDGEADSLQQTTMFASLATDVDLQQEFSEALSMHRAFEHERSHTKPPMYLTNRVFQDAGILPKAIGASAVGTGLWLWLRRAAIPVGALVVGSVLTFFGMSWSGRTTNTLSQSSPAQSATPIIAANTSSTTTSSQQSSPTTSKGGTPAFAREQATSNSAHSPRAIIHARSEQQRPALPHDGSETIDLSSNMDPQTESFLSEQSQISLASALSNNSTSRKLSMVRVGSAPVATGKTSDWTLQLNRLMGGDVVGSAHSSPVTFAADPSITLFYNLNENVSLGGSYTQSSFSVSDITKNGVTLQNPRLTIYGIEAQFMSQQEYILGAQGYARVGIGVSTNTGATLEVGTLNAGLSFPVSILRLNTGVAMEGMYYRSQSQFPLSGKISFVMGLSWNVTL